MSKIIASKLEIMVKNEVFLIPRSMSQPLGGGILGGFGGCEMGVFTLIALLTLPTWRMLHAGGQTMTFCTDHIRHYYHHCFSSNRAEHPIPKRHKHTKWGNRRQCGCTYTKVMGAGVREKGRLDKMTSLQSKKKKIEERSCPNQDDAKLHKKVQCAGLRSQLPVKLKSLKMVKGNLRLSPGVFLETLGPQAACPLNPPTSILFQKLKMPSTN